MEYSFNDAMILTLTKQVGRSFYLSIRLLPSTLRQPVALAYLLARASDTIADEGESVKKSERELVRALPLLIEKLNDSRRDCFDAHEIKVVWEKIMEGQRFDLDNFTTRNEVNLLTSDQLDRYLYLVAGCVGEFWTKLAAHHFPNFATEPLEQMMAWGVDYGKGLQLVNMLRDFSADEKQGRFYFSEKEKEHYHEQAYAYLQQGEKYVSSLRPSRFKIATALPLLLGKQTLALLKKYPKAEKLKITRWSVYATLLGAGRYLFW